MTSTVDLSQPDFTYCRINQPQKHSEYIRMQKLYEKDKLFDQKYAKQVHELSKKKKLDALKQRRSERRNSALDSDNMNVLLRDSVYPLPDVKQLNRKHFVAKTKMEDRYKTTNDSKMRGKAKVPNHRPNHLQTHKDPSVFNVKNAMKSI